MKLDSVSSQQIDALPLLDALIAETWRLYPPGMGPSTGQGPEKGATIGLCYVPDRTTVGASPYFLHKNSQAFLNPLERNKHRWLDATLELKKKMMRWYWVFGSGRQMCIGIHLAIRCE